MWESCKVKTTADPNGNTKAHFSFANNVMMIPMTSGKVKRKRWTFWKVCVPLHLVWKRCNGFQKMNIRQTNMMVIGWLSGTAWCFRIWTTCCNWRNHWFQFVPQNPEAVISHYKKRLWTKSKECGILFVCGLHCPAHAPEAGETNSAAETYLGTAVVQVEPKARSTHSHPSW